MNTIDVPVLANGNIVNKFLAVSRFFRTFTARNELNYYHCKVQKSSKIRRGYYCKVDLVRFATSQIPAVFSTISSIFSQLKVANNG